MYIDKEGKDWVVINESGHVIATRKTEKEAQKFMKAQKATRNTKNNRRQERVTYSSRSDD
jgi:hypothetical protein